MVHIQYGIRELHQLHGTYTVREYQEKLQDHLIFSTLRTNRYATLREINIADSASVEYRGRQNVVLAFILVIALNILNSLQHSCIQDSAACAELRCTNHVRQQAHRDKRKYPVQEYSTSGLHNIVQIVLSQASLCTEHTTLD